MKSWKIISLLVAIVILGVFIWPIRHELEVLQAEIVTLEKKQLEKTNEYRRIQDHFAMIKNEEKQYQYIPSHLTQAAFLSEIQRISSDSGFFIQNYAFSKGINKDLDLQQMNAFFVLEGSESKIIRFLQLVEKNPLFLGVENVSFPPLQDGKYTINISLYSLYES